MLPFNIASYALLAQIIGKITNMVPKGIIGDLSNVHIYEPHIKAVKKQLNNSVYKYESPGIIYNTKNWDIDSLNIEDFVLDSQESYPSIKAEMLAYNK